MPATRLRHARDTARQPTRSRHGVTCPRHARDTGATCRDMLSAYWLTATHLCYANATSWSAAGGAPTVAARVSTTGFVVTNRSNMLADSRIASAPAASSDLT
eukprot:1050997-Prymnesium_polylepis.1